MLPYLFYICFLIFSQSSVVLGKFQPPDLPPELQDLYTRDLDTWKAPEELKKNYPYYLAGYDEEQHPIWVVELGKWDLRAVIEAGGKTKEAFDKYADQTVFNIFNSSFLEDGTIIKTTGILDFDGFALRQLSSPKTLEYMVRKVRLIVASLRNLESAFIINTNFVAQKFLNLVKPLLGSNLEKLEIYGTNPTHWKPKILRQLPRNQLPQWYGGSKDFKPVQVYG